MIYNRKLSTLLSLALMVLLFASCDKGGEDPSDATSISISSSVGTVFEIDTESSFVVKDNLDKDVTSASEIYVGGTKISGSSYTFKEKGSFEVYAKHKDLTSNKLTITVKEAPSSSVAKFTSKVLAHEFTGTWCGHCAGPLLELKEKFEKFNGKFIPIEIHSGGSGIGADGVESFDFPNSSIFKVEAQPTLWYNFDKQFEYFSSEDIATYVTKKSKTGLAIHYNLEGNNATIKIKSDKNLNGLKIAVYLLEGKLVATQYNYENNNPQSKAYQKGDEIHGLVYDNVARASLTNSPLGDVISDANGTEHTMIFSLDGKKEKVKDIKNTKVVAFLLDKNDKYINAQSALANENKDFD